MQENKNHMDKEEVLRYVASFEGLDRHVDKCKDDMCRAMARGRVSLEEQVRAYDLLNRFLELGKEAMEYADPVFGTSLYHFGEEYRKAGDSVNAITDVPALMREAEALLAPLQEKLDEARFEAASAASLHEFAKEVFDIWQTQGIFARKRALRELRERAGFRLESHRIGNYVAKTFDLMNEAQIRFAKAQQALYAADVRYKIKPDIYGQLMEMIPEEIVVFCGLKYADCLDGKVRPVETTIKRDIWI